MHRLDKHNIDNYFIIAAGLKSPELLVWGFESLILVGGKWELVVWIGLDVDLNSRFL